MMTIRSWCVLALVSFALVGGAARADDASVHIMGSNSLLPAAQRVAEAYMTRHPDVIVVVRGGDSGPGLKALLDGTTDVAMISSAIPAATTKRAKALSVTLSARTVALDALVPIVHRDNEVSDLTVEQLGRLFGGAVSDWSALGVPAAAVTLVSPPAGSGTAAAWRAAVLDGGVQTPKARQVASARMKAAVAADPSAIGYLGLGAVDGSVKAVAVDGVTAGRGTLLDGTYPLRREMALVTRDDASPAVMGFVAFFASAEARAAVEEAGLLPAGRKE